MEIIYENKTYKVIEPGTLKYNEKGELLNQLSENLQPFPRTRKKFLKDNYSLSELGLLYNSCIIWNKRKHTKMFFY